MSSPVPTLDQRRFTVDEYHRMAETGILAPEERVELIRGVIRRMSPKNRAHVIAAALVQDLLRDALKGLASVYPEAPLVVEEIDSEPQPDVMVCSNPDTRSYGTARTRPLLVVEIADSSVEYDLKEKANLYASARIPEYWVVNLEDRVLEVFRKPGAGAYELRLRLSIGESVSPEAWPNLDFEVSSLFP
jgi:Uma2 family endonuclease